MRLSVVDAGSYTVQLAVADVSVDGRPEFVTSFKQRLRLGQRTDRSGAIRSNAVRDLVAAVRRAGAVSRRYRADDLYALGTASIRDARNASVIAKRVHRRTGIPLHFLSGEEEARLTFAAVRRWLGTEAGPVLLLDIGGTTAEIAWGARAEPSFAVSLPLGAGRLTRSHVKAERPSPASLRRLTDYVEEQLDPLANRARRAARHAQPVAASRTFQQLAQLCCDGDPDGAGWLRMVDLRRWIPRLASMSPDGRARLPGITRPRAHQSLAGAVIAYRLMRVLELDRIAISPWALREGIMLDRALSVTAARGGRPRGRA